jgi:membrane protease YdiL (CAAX protease family)
MNTDNQNFSNILLIALLSLVFPIMHAAQSSSESVYSDQAFDPSRVNVWYTDPFLWGAVILTAVGAFFWWKRRK